MEPAKATERREGFIPNPKLRLREQVRKGVSPGCFMVGSSRCDDCRSRPDVQRGIPTLSFCSRTIVSTLDAHFIERSELAVEFDPHPVKFVPHPIKFEANLIKFGTHPIKFGTHLIKFAPSVVKFDPDLIEWIRI